MLKFDQISGSEFALANLELSPGDELELLVSALQTALDGICRDQPFWRVAPDGKLEFVHAQGISRDSLEIPSGDVPALFFRFGTEEGRLVLDAGYYRIPSAEQGKGHARKFLQALYPASLAVNIKRVTACANEDLGGYAWAKYGGVPMYRDRVVRELDKRAQRLVATGNWAEIHYMMLRRYLDGVSDIRMMSEIADLELIGRPAAGKQLLTGEVAGRAFAWDACWNLDDSDQRAHIESCLEGAL